MLADRGENGKEAKLVLRRDLAEIRARHLLTVDDAAAQAGVGRTTYMKAEAGIAVGPATARRIANLYRVDFWAIVDQAILPPSEPKGVLFWIVESLGPIMRASNALEWRVCELRHRSD